VRFSEPLGVEARFPPLTVQMIRVGEESGELADILLQVANTYDRDTQVTVKRTLAVLEPALILVLGVIIAAKPVNVTR
jgi:general secretion pathway protein F